jgi:Caspase domain
MHTKNMLNQNHLLISQYSNIINMSDSSTEKSNMHAVLIGIDCYLPNRLPDGGTYPTLGGCVRDINHVEDFLVQNLKVPQENIHKLSSSIDLSSDKPAEPQDKWPSYENMVNAFKRVTDNGQPGDEVYIHYAGHGGRANTIYPDLKTKEGQDETLVPLDIGNSEARYLRDVELAHILKTMVDKGLVVTIVLDSCHSGGATRALLDEKGPDILKNVAVRGISNKDTTARPTNSLIASAEELIKTWKSITGSTRSDKTRGFEPGSGWLPQSIGYTLVAACEPQESAHEAAFDAGGESNGALTYFFLKSLRKNIAPGTTYRQIHNELLTKIHAQFPNQTPMLEGEGNREVFGSKKVQLISTVNVKEVDNEKGRILLDAGKIHGINQGAQFAVYPSGLNDLTQIDNRIAIVEIDELHDTDSYARVIQGSSQKIEEGAQAVLIDAGTMNIKKKVRLVLQQNNKEIPIAKQKEALSKIKDALPEAGKGYLVLVEDNNNIGNDGNNQKPDYQLAINEKGEYEILDPSGLPIVNIRPPIKIDDQAGDAVERVVKRLVHLVNYNNIQQLDNVDSTSSSLSSNKLVIELFGLPENYDPTKRPTRDQLLQLETKGNVKIVKKGQKLALRIENKLPKVPGRQEQSVIKVAILDLDPTWGIQQVYPNPAESDYNTLDPESDDIIPFQASLPTGYNTGKDILKAFGVFEPTNFRWLELPPLDQPPTRGSTRLRASARAPANQLEKLMSDMTPDNARGVDLLTPPSYATKAWTVAQLEVQINDT